MGQMTPYDDNDYVYQMAEYTSDSNGDDVSLHNATSDGVLSDNDDNLSATIRFDDLGNIHDNLMCNDENEYFKRSYESDMLWSSSSYLSSSDSTTSVLSFNENPLPPYAPSLFSTIPPHLSSAYQFQVKLNSLLSRQA